MSARLYTDQPLRPILFSDGGSPPVIVQTLTQGPMCGGYRTVMIRAEVWTLERAELIYRMYREAFGALLLESERLDKDSPKCRRHDWWLRRWLAVPDVLASRVS